MSKRQFEARIGARHPMLDHHRVYGKAVLPGLAYIDLLYQLARDVLAIDHREYALRRLAIHAPLAIDDGDECDLQFCFEGGSACWSVEVKRVEVKRVDETRAPVLLATAELRAQPIAHAKRVDIAALTASASARIDMARIYAAARDRGLTHSGPMRATGEIFVLGDDRLVRLAADGVEAPLLFHPALIDGAAMATESLRADDDPALYLPLFYDAFSCSQALGTSCCAWIRRDSVRSVNDIHTLDIEFYDAQGRQVGALEGVTSKRVRAPEHITGTPVVAVHVDAAHAAAVAVPAAEDSRAQQAAPAADSRRIEHTLRAIVAARLGIPADHVDATAGFFTLGLQSSQLLSVVADIEKAYRLSLSPTLLFEFGTIAEVAAHLGDALMRTSDAAPADGQSATSMSTPPQPDDRRAARAATEYLIGANDQLLEQHRIQGRFGLMGVVHPCLAMDSAARDAGHYPITLRRIVFHGGPIMPAPGEHVLLRVEWSSDEGGDEFRVLRRPDDEIHCAGRWEPTDGTVPQRIDPDALWASGEALGDADLQRIYAGIPDFEVGDTLRTIQAAVRIGSDRLVCRIDTTGKIQRTSDGCAYPLDPILLGACYFIDPGEGPGLSHGALVVPFAIERLTLYRPIPAQALIVNTARTGRDGFAAFDAMVYDTDGVCVAAIGNASMSVVRDLSRFRANAVFAQSAPQMAAPSVAHAAVPRAEQQTPVRHASLPQARRIEHMLRAIVAARLGIPADHVDATAGFFTLGLQSSQLLSVVADLEKAYRLSLSPTLLFEFGTIAEVAAHLGVLPELVGQMVPDAPPGGVAGPQPVTEYRIDANDRLLDDHRIQGQLALMGIVHPCLAMDSAARGGSEHPIALRRIVFHGGPIMPAPDERILLRVEWSPAEGGDEFRVLRHPGDDLHCSGQRIVVDHAEPPRIDLDALWATGEALGDAELQRVYEGVPDFRIGDTLRTIVRAVRIGKNRLVSRIDMTGKTRRTSDGRVYPLDPILLASCYFIEAGDGPGLGDGALMVPLAIERLALYRPVPAQAVIVNTVHTQREGFVAFDAEIHDTDGVCVAAIRNASMSIVPDLSRLGIDALLAGDAADEPQPSPQAQPSRTANRVAIVGLSGRYPMARDLDEFWRNLKSGRDCVGEIPSERWDWRDYYSPDPRQPGKIPSKWGGFIDDIDQFAPLFFAIAPREAAYMDPQERLFLEESWNVLEDAGYTRATFGGGQVGVYVGVMTQEYALYAVEQHAGAGRIGIPSGTGSIANRVSYSFDFRGPSITVDTMCSGSLTAIALAFDALCAGRIDGALAGGVNLSVHPNKYLMLGQGGFLSSQGKCGSFGTGSGGYVPGEGVGAVLLKRLDDAIHDGDRILGVIRGIATNHGGRTSGYSVPNPKAQYDVVRRAWQLSGVDARLINYIEAHGTGTLLGDPIEIDGLNRAFREYTDATGFCAIGSVKSNIGHCESAAGIAALSKVLLQLKHGELVPSLHCETLNPNIDFERSPFVVQRQSAPWPRPALQQSDGRRIEFPRVAGISSFGAGGSNAHMLVEEFIATATPVRAPSRLLIVLSAKTADELDVRIERLLNAIRDEVYREEDLPAIAYTLQVGREAMDERFAVVVGTLRELETRLTESIEDAPATDVYRARAGADKALSLFARDDDFADTVAMWAGKGKLGELAELWVHGVAVDWRLLYPQATPKRIGLPTYPFTRQRCWITDRQPLANAAAATAGPPTTREAEPAERAGGPTEAAPIVFSEVWMPAQIAASARDPSDIRSPTCLVFASAPERRAQIAAGILHALPQANIVFVVDAMHGAVDGAADDDCVQVVGDDPESFGRAFAALRERVPRVDIALYMWALEDAAFVSDARGLMYGLQAISNSGIAVDRFLAGGHFAPGSIDECHLEAQDAILRSAAQALPLTRFAAVFKESDASPDMADWSRRLIAEARAERIEAARYRDGHRFVRDIRRTAMPTEAGAGAGSPLKQGGTYLVAGGLGGLGLAVSRHLAGTLRGGLVIVGRSPLDGHRRELLEMLERLGARVSYVACDLADAAALRAGLAAVRPRTGPIHGVIHAAGVAGTTTIIDKTLAEFRSVLSPKIAGTLVLDEVLRDEPLDFVCYFSSLAAVLGDFGSCDYASANRFQMAYAGYRNRAGLPGRTVAINWPLWDESGLEFGTSESRALYLKISGQQPLSSEDALRILPDLLALQDPAPIVMVGEYERLRATLNARPAHATRGIAPAHPETAAGAPSASGSLPRRIERDLREAVGALLHIALDQVHRNTNLADFGFDSVSLQEFAVRLSDRYGIDVAAALFYDYPSIDRLAAHLAGRHAAAMAAALADPDAAVESTAQATPDASSVIAPGAGGVASATDVGMAATSPPGLVAETPAASGRRAAEAGSRRADDAAPIAVIGISGRFPQARDVTRMWEVLAEGLDAITEIPIERFDWRNVFAPGAAAVPGKTNCKWSGIVPGAGEFDPLFFEISPREAAQIDPRQRLLLQEAYRALEDAGYGPKQLAAGCVGVFIGAEGGAYQGVEAEQDTITANHEAILAARLSYFLDLTGPNLAINTACSSGLVALHQACLHLRTGECDTAIAGAVNLLLACESFIGMSQTGMLSPDGRCFAFDSRANGMVPGEAVVALVLKRLVDAEADGDPIHALIRGSGVNYDGRTNGMTAPSGRAQQRLLAGVYDACHVDPADIEYVIAHGTATNLGDQIEVRALCDVFAARSDRRRYCALTSTKSNFGHTFAPSGLVSLVAMIQAMRHEMIPRSLHCERENAYVRWQDSPFFVNTVNRPWPKSPDRPRLGAVSAFGMSGTNAHAVVESYDRPRPRTHVAHPLHLLPLSAKDGAALRRCAAALAAWLAVPRAEAVDLAEVSHTLFVGRHHYRHRAALIVDSVRTAIAELEGMAAGIDPHGMRSGEVARDFVADPAAESQIARLLQRCARTAEPVALGESLAELAGLYCEGHDAEWSVLYGRTPPARIHLPGYPFDRKHYWVARAATPAPIETVTPASAPSGLPSPTTPLTERVEALVYAHLGLERGTLSSDDPLDEFGLDSIGATKLVAQIREVLPDVVGSLFLEYNTLGGVREYLRAYRGTQVAVALPEPAVPVQSASVPDAVGIVGMAGLFPHADDIDTFWDNLRAGRVLTGVLPSRRRTLLGLPEINDSLGGFIELVDTFDHVRFKMSHEEARTTDPQLRKLIETVWRAVADSGYTMADFRKRPTGVFVATSGHSGYREIPDFVAPGAGLPPGETASLYANRISNLFDLKGPSVAADAGCAGFLVALGDALAALDAGRCEQAVVATAQLYLSPYALSATDRGPLYSKGRTTRSFAKDSDGYVRSEAVGAVILKKIPQALRDRDPVYCTLLGTGASHGGKSPLKWYSPNVGGQRAAIREALQRAGVAGRSIGYVETEANGSQLGDASEIIAIQSEYRSKDGTETAQTCFGSLKPLCGHAETASTLPALVKVVMSLLGRDMLGVVDPGEINEGIKLEPGFEILVGARPWPATPQPRRAALHSLSVGGMNAHVVLEAFADAAAETQVAPAMRWFAFSAPTPDLLRSTVEAHLRFLSGDSPRRDLDPADIAHTLLVGRESESCRLAVVADSLDALCAQLAGWLDGGSAGSGPPLQAEGAPEALVAQADAWMRGGKIAVAELYAPGSRRRVHLPATALRQDSHWHRDLAAAVPKPPVSALPAPVRPAQAVEPVLAESLQDSAVGAVLLKPKWIKRAIGARGDRHASPPAIRRTVFCGWPKEAFDELRRLAGEDEEFRAIEFESVSISEQFRTFSKAVFRMVREVLAELGPGRGLLQVVLPSGLEYVGHHGLVGLMRTAAKEHSRFSGQIVVLDRTLDAASSVDRLRRIALEPTEDYVQVRRDACWTQVWEVMRADATVPAVALPGSHRREPVILVTGGAGGIGLDLAERILQTDDRAKVVLAGRSINPRQSERIARLQVRGDRLHYIPADVGSQSDVESLIAEILRRCGTLTGIFHCAGVTRDAYIVKKDMDDIDAVLMPKVAGLYHLDEATREIPLEFLVAFSSLSSMSGNAGQADYSMANGFMDAFAVYRNQLVCLGERSGRTLSINWPMWAGGGMTMNDAVVRDIEKRSGLMSMPNAIGIGIAMRLLDGSAAQVAVKYGKMAKLLNDHAECI